MNHPSLLTENDANPSGRKMLTDEEFGDLLSAIYECERHPDNIAHNDLVRLVDGFIAARVTHAAQIADEWLHEARGERMLPVSALRAVRDALRFPPEKTV